MTHGRLVYTMDATGRSDVETAVETWRDVQERYARLGLQLARPVSLVIEDMPIMGATESTKDGHRLHLAAHAVRSAMLDGLIAHETGHMVLTEQAHPSHRVEVHRRAFESIDVPAGQKRAFGGVARGGVNHVEDIYADDLAIQVIGRKGDVASFFSQWVRNSARPGGTRWATVGNGVTVAFALGNMARHGIGPEGGVVPRAEAFAKTGNLKSFPRFVDAFRNLPVTEETDPVEGAIRGLLIAIASEGLGRN